MIKRSRDILLNIKGDIKSPFFKWKYGNMEVWKYGSMEVWKSFHLYMCFVTL
jgi:hypothetical protein